MRTLTIERPPAERCEHERVAHLEPPSELVDPRSEKRLVGELREAARTRDAREILARASLRALSATDPRSRRLAQAMADLAATGEAAAASLSRTAPRASDLATLAAARMPGLRADDPGLVEASAKMLDRASAVARYLALEPVRRRAFLRVRPDLTGWIAVSGEDDLPPYPVNVQRTPMQERRCRVTVGEDTLGVRYTISGRTDGLAPIVLLVHGHSSRLEEHDGLAAALSTARGPDGQPKYCIVSPDLPGCGYSERIDHETLAPPDAPGAPALAFLEDFLEAFVDTLTREMGAPNRVACVAGGSLGGNLVLRLAERRVPWAARFAAWSPASVWRSLHGDLIKGIGVSHTRDNMWASESSGSRRNYFREVFATPICLTGRTQPEMWYRDGFGCRPRHITGAIWERREIYDRSYRRWHWRLAHEQLVFSHVEVTDGAAPWEHIRGPLLLVAGAQDNFSWTHIHDRTRDLADLLASRGVPGICLLLGETGHSVHDERPRLLAGALDRFIETQPAAE